MHFGVRLLENVKSPLGSFDSNKASSILILSTVLVQNTDVLGVNARWPTELAQNLQTPCAFLITVFVWESCVHSLEGVDHLCESGSAGQKDSF